MDQLNLGSWIDRSDMAQGGVSDTQARLIHATLGKHAEPAPEQNDALPPLWHWYAFPPTASMDQLGPDGHPRLGDFMPPLRLNRRMWAGGSLEFFAPLKVGEPLTRRTTIANISEKTGAGGDIVIVSLDHEIHGTRGLAVMERQNIVYLQIPDQYVPPKAIPVVDEPAIAETVTVNPPLLFRYSAITFNAHRIHYDLPYTQTVEHYPDLVVHGPLQAQLLMDAAIRHRGSSPKLFSYRGVHPLFLGDELDLRVEKKSTSEWALSTNANKTHQCMQASAVWEI